ncbi:hypothetical protein [Intestinimonas butyriciproducens]|uniref:hypothetical protein n=1 Tax=Intestinimonas butyriciproducens TaxID=1297617 RepID=UPI0019590BAE|nr:hypothetical protein [Intestinimonas butyriciproducens]MBM6976429.1 hypothetical protein [Intestinimonas butyriciproducens]
MEEGKKKRKYTEGVKQSNRQWDAKNLDRLSVAAPKGTKERWKTAAEEQGQSLNQFIVNSVESAIKAPQRPQEAPAVQDTTTAQQRAQERPTEGIPLHTLEQRIRRTLYRYNGAIRKDRKSGGYTVVYEDTTLDFPDYAALLEYADKL